MQLRTKQMRQAVSVVFVVCSFSLWATALANEQNQSVWPDGEDGDVQASGSAGQAALNPEEDPTISELFRWGIGTRRTIAALGRGVSSTD
eukprot:1529328-Pyramimonas_sp.AAC.1